MGWLSPWGIDSVKINVLTFPILSWHADTNVDWIKFWLDILTGESCKCFTFHFSHIPHVMTLFDRRVDLARFSPDTPLYVMCREWMSNNPQKASVLNLVQDSVPSQQSLSPHYPNTLAPPTPLSKDSKGVVIRLDIPLPHPPHTKDKQELDDVLYQVCMWSQQPGGWRRGENFHQVGMGYLRLVTCLSGSSCQV